MNDILIREDTLKYPHLVREAAVRSEYKELNYRDGATYKHISTEHQPDLRGLLRELLDDEVEVTERYFRMDLDGELPHNICHADTIAADYVALLYLSDPKDAPNHSGTAFWKHRLYGLSGMPTESESEQLGWNHEELCGRIQQDWTNPDVWELTLHVSCQYNRLLVYPTSRFHSRYPFQGGGAGRGNGRIIHLSFFSFSKDQVRRQSNSGRNGAAGSDPNLLQTDQPARKVKHENMARGVEADHSG